MLAKKDYAKMTHDELLAEEKQLKKQRIIGATFVGFLFGIAIYAAVHGSLLLPAIVVLFALGIGREEAERFKSLQEEIGRRS